MLELQTALYHDLIERPTCVECDRAPRLCSEPYGLTGDGFSVGRATGEDIVVSWPACPRRWGQLRRLGGTVTTLAGVAAWAVERGVHRRRHVPARTAQLCRQYLSSREAPESLKLARRREERRLEQLAKDAARKAAYGR